MSELLCKINSLAIFKGIRDVEPLKSLCDFLRIADDVSQTRYNVLDKYTEFVNALYDIRHDGDISAAIWRALRYDDNAFLQAHIAKETAKIRGIKEPQITHMLKNGAEKELSLINEIARTSYAELEPLLAYDEYVAQFKTTGIDIKERYLKMTASLAKEGYGMFMDYHVFKAEGCDLIPIEYPDPVTMDDLFCYERQHGLVINNTAGFVKGKTAKDILLYGEEGTGKSATVRAAARRFAPEGVRLVKLSATDISHLTEVVECLEQIPLRFIILIDDATEIPKDLTAVERKNILIYATADSKKVKGASAFGLKIQFEKPSEKEYLEITRRILDRHGVVIGNEEALGKSAEEYAEKAGGRSARTARRFADQIIP